MAAATRRQAAPDEARSASARSGAAEQPLFRPQVVAERQAQWLGTILLEPRRTHAFLSGAALVGVAALIFLPILFGSFTRKARIGGWLAPQQGLARVFAPQAGIVTKIEAREGDEVRKGAPLLTISAELQTEGLLATRGEAVRQLKLRRESMGVSKGAQERLVDQQASDMAERVKTLETEQRHIVREIEIQVQRTRLGKETFDRETEMRRRGLIPLPRLQRTQQEYLDQSARLQTLQRTRATLERELVTARGAVQEMPLRARTQLGEFDRNIAVLEQDLAEAETRRRIVITAPEDGVVTSMQVELGGSVATNVPLLTVVPRDHVLQAHLFSPSRGVGFVRPGQKVLLRFQAFPYQKFGFHEGVVSAVSRSATSPSELPQQLTGFANLSGANEPLYRVTVNLSRQTVLAYGKQAPLQPGMQVDADVHIESRRLIEWMFDPLFTITGRWN